MDAWLPMTATINPAKLFTQLREDAVDLPVTQWLTKMGSARANKKKVTAAR